MTLSNYPPGVSGMEWQIRGPRERQIHAECDADAKIVTRHLVDDHIAGVQDLLPQTFRTDTEKLAVIAGRLEQLTAELDAAEQLGQCAFTGDVDACFWGDAITWVCPHCGTEHEEAVDRDDF